MANNSQMTFSIGIKTNYDAEGIRRLQSDLTKLQQSASSNVNFQQYPGAIKESLKAAQSLKIALSEAYNPKLGTLTIDRFNQSLKKSGITLQELQKGLHNFGSAGDIAFSNAAIDLLKMNNIAKSSTTLFDKMFNTFKNTITWGLSSALWNNITGSIQKSYYYIKDLDEALNDIRIVTSKSNEEMEKFAVNANNAAKALAVSTEDYTQGALIYYQQGLSDEEVKRRTDITAKTSNVTGQSMSAVSEQLTAVWNGYKVSAAEAELYVDRLAAVAATTASDLEELSTGMSKVASSAAALGVSEEQLAAMLSTTISVTRQAPESVGTAYKTIFARISDIEAGLDAETSLGNYTEKMAAMGITVLDASGKLRDMGDVIEEIGSKWAMMSREQQISLAQTMAGTRQYNNLVALFDNWSSYADTLQVAANAEGTLDKQQAIAMDSIKNRLDVLKSTWEDLYQNLFDSDDIKEAITGLTKLVQLLADFTEAVGGLKTILPGILSIVLQIGSVKIANELSIYISNLQSLKGELGATEEAARKFKDEMLKGSGVSLEEASPAQIKALDEVYGRYQQIIDLKKYMNDQDRENLNILLDQEKELVSLKIKAEEYTNKLSKDSDLGELESVYNINNNELDKLNLIRNLSGGGINFNTDDKGLLQIATLKTNISELAAEMKILVEQNGVTEKSIQNTFKNINMSSDQVKFLKDKFEELSYGLENKLPQATKKFIQELTSLEKEIGNVENTFNNLEVKEAQLIEMSRTFQQGFQLNATINQITQMTSVLTGAASGISSLINAFKTLENDNLSTSQKILQIMMSLGFSVSMLMKPLQSINGIIKSFKAELTYIKSLEEAHLSKTITQEELKLKIEEQQLLVEKAKSAELKKQEAANALLAGGGPLSEKERARWEYLDSKNIPSGNRSNEYKALKKRVNLEEDYKKAVDAANKAAQDVAEGEKGLPKGTSAGGLVGWIVANPMAAAAIVGTILAIAAAIGTLYAAERKREQELKEKNERLEKIKEEAKALEEQKQKLEDTTKSYEGLKTQLREGKITEQEFRDQALQLTDSLEDQALKTQLLAGQYDNLSNSLENAQRKQNAMLMAQYENEQKAADASMEAGLAKGTTFWQDIKKYSGINNIGNLIPTIGAGRTFLEIATSFGAIGEDKIKIGSSSDASANKDIVSSFEKALANGDYNGLDISKITDQTGFNITGISDKNKNELYELIDKVLQENAQYADTESYQELEELKKNLQTGYDAYKESTNKINEIKKNELVLDVNKENIDSKEKFKQEVDLLVQQALDQKLFDPEKGYNDARIWAISALQGISDETNQWAKEQSLISAIVENSKVEDQENATKILEGMNLSKEDLTFLSVVAPALKDEFEEGTIQGILEGSQNAIEYIKKQNFQLDIQAAISLANTNHSFDKEGIRAIFKEGLDGINEEDFFNAGYAEQMQTMILSSVKAQKEFANSPELAQAASDEIQKQIDKLEEDQAAKNYRFDSSYFEDKINKDIISSEGIIAESYGDSNIGGKAISELADELNNYIDAVAKGENANEDFYNALIENNIVTEDQIKNLVDQRKEYFELTNAIADLQSYQATLTSGEVDYATAIKNTQDVMDHYDKLVDGVQSAYKTLHTAEQEWNEEGSYTVDTIQSLLKMNPAYIECLEVQGDKISVNEEKVNEYTTALLRNEIVMAEQAFLLQMKEALEKGTTSSQWASIMATDTATASTLSLNDSLREEIRLKYEDALANDKLTQSEYDLAMAKLNTMEADYQALYNQAPNARQNDKKSGSSSSSSKDQKNYFSEFDRYWELKKNLEIIGNAIDKLDKKEKNLYGKEKIAALKNKNELIDQQKEAYKALYAEQQKEQAELVGSLQGMGVTFDADGNITNYVAQTSAKLDEYNKAVAAYNSGKMSKKSFDKVEDDYKNFKEYLERYDKLYYSEMKDTADKLAEATRKQMENNLEAWRIEVEIKVDWQKLEREWNNFIADMSKDFTRQFENLDIDLNLSRNNAATYTGEDGTLPVELQQAQDIMDEIDKIMSGEGSDKFESVSQAQEELKKVNSSILSDGTALKKVYEDAYNTFLKKIQQYGEKLEQQMGYYDRIDEQLNHQKELIGLLYGDEAYALMDEYYKGQEKNSLARLESLKTQTDMWEAMYNSAEEGSKEQQEYYEKMVAAQQNLNKETENYIKLLKEDMVNSIKKASKEYENYLTDGKGFDLIKQEWDDLKDYSDNYFDGVEKKYQISAFGNKVDEGINAQDSLAAQKKLQDLKDYELAQLKEKKELTQYDIDAAEQRYNIALKEIALEEAQNAKNSMKVTRDTNGNWTYQYVADDTDVNKKRQELSDEIYKLYEMSKDAYQENIDNMIALQENYLKSVEEIKIELANLDDGDLERKKALEAELDRLNQQYYDKYDTLAKRNFDLKKDAEASYVGVILDTVDKDKTAYEELTENEKTLVGAAKESKIESYEDLEKAVKTGNLHMKDDLETKLGEESKIFDNTAESMAKKWNGDSDSVKGQHKTALDEMGNAVDAYQIKVHEASEKVGEDFGPDGIKGNIDKATESVNTIKAAIDDICSLAIYDLPEVRDKVEEIAEAWRSVSSNIGEAIQQIKEYLKKVGEVDTIKVSTPFSSVGGPGNTYDNGGKGSDGNNEDKTPAYWSVDTKGQVIILNKDKQVIETPEANGMSQDKVAGTYKNLSYYRSKAIGWAPIMADGSINENQIDKLDNESLLDYLNKRTAYNGRFKGSYMFKEFATGGYTGDWSDPAGKLAILHGKELVLNQTDTANILSAVDAIRQISSVGSSISASIAQGIAAMFTGIGSIPSIVSGGDTSNRQNIFNIEASFPNANNVDEIQQAILSLPNLASQYIARTTF